MKINSFNPVASRYSSQVAPRRMSQFLTLVHELELDGSEEVLDIGTGPGELSIQVANQLNNGGFLTGIDISANMIRLAKEIAKAGGHENVSFGHGDAMDLKFRDNSFDVVVSSNAFPWVPDRAQFVREVYRVLRPGGRFALVALSNQCYREFASAFKSVSEDNPGMFPEGKPFAVMGAKLHGLSELVNFVSRHGFNVAKQFQLSTEEPIDAQSYIDRVNAIVNENYLDHMNGNGEKDTVRRMLFDKMAERNGTLKVTESSIFVVAEKKAPEMDFSI